ncbi:hypothetical protein [Aeromicrobium massiliense]|nr:hypothetical protein [Aeromicrobium massiliense]
MTTIPMHPDGPVPGSPTGPQEPTPVGPEDPISTPEPPAAEPDETR